MFLTQEMGGFGHQTSIEKMDQWLSIFTNKHLDFEKNKLADSLWEDGWTKKTVTGGLSIARFVGR